MIYSLRYFANCAGTAAKCETSIPFGQPFADVSGVKRYPVYWNEITDIWLRYRVIKCRVKVVFYPTGATSSLVGAMYPYRSATSGLDNLDAVIGQTGSEHKPLNYSTGQPVTIIKHFNLHEMYKLLNDNTENGLEGPDTWSKATHQWNKIPTY